MCIPPPTPPKPINPIWKQFLYKTIIPGSSETGFAIVFDKIYAAAYHSGNHSELQKGSKVQLVKLADPAVSFEAVVCGEKELWGFLVIKVPNPGFAPYPLTTFLDQPPQSIVSVRIDDNGLAASENGVLLKNERGACTCELSQAQLGDGIFDSDGGFLGIIIEASDEGIALAANRMIVSSLTDRKLEGYSPT